MKVNPIIRRDMIISSRSAVLPMLVTAVDTAMFGCALISTFSVLSEMRRTGTADYATLMSIFDYLAAIEYVILMMIVPALAAGSIASERESGKLDLLMISNLNGRKLIFGKLFSTAQQMGVIIVSTLPALMVPMVYGGITASYFVRVAVMLFAESLFAACICLFVSALSSTTVRSMAISYAYMLALLLLSLQVFRIYPGGGLRDFINSRLMVVMMALRGILAALLLGFAVLNLKPKRSKINSL